MAQILWQPDQELAMTSNLAGFMLFIQQQFSASISNYQALHEWSISHPEQFWQAVWDFCDINAEKKADQVFVKGEKFEDAKWFVGAKLNFAANLLSRNDDHIALIFASERGERRQITFRELNQQVAILAAHLQKKGVKAGDRVAAVLPNTIETVVAMLATASLGAVWSSCSPDFGLQGLVDRFAQIAPKVLFAVDGHFYNGKTFQHLETIRELQRQLPSLVQTIVVPYVNKEINNSGLNNAILYSSVIASAAKQSRISRLLRRFAPRNDGPENNAIFETFQFNHPLYILYSSGTTGKPKCMVHGAGGTLIQHLKELVLHTNLTDKDRIFYYTTCGWMMWHWLISSLAVGTTVILYDGSNFYPTPSVLFDLIDELQITVFGTSAKYLESVEKANLEPKKSHQLKSLRTILSTGSPLLSESFDYVYENVKSDVQLSSISGGSDIISCFALGNPLLPVYRGELQCIGLGMDVKIFNEQGKSIVNEKGELICASPFPSMPIYFWNDPTGEKYHNAYFAKFPNVWAHGDYALLTERNTMVIFGRSDATLKPGGVRIGTAEIYNQVSQFTEITDSVAIGQAWQGSERVILFVVMQKDFALTPELITNIKTTIRTNVSPYHVPAKIIAVPDIPRTRNVKIAELAVKKIINNEPVQNKEALANPEALDYFKDLIELKN